MDDLEAKTFTSFRKLAPELRNHIWRLASIQPRIMKVKHDDMKYTYKSLPEDVKRVQVFSTDVRPSSLLEACKESRGNFLIEYPNKLETRVLAGEDNDVGNGVALRRLEKAEIQDTEQALAEIKHLSIDWMTLTFLEQYQNALHSAFHTPLLTTLSYFRDLKNLVLIHGKVYQERWYSMPSTPSEKVRLMSRRERVEAGIEQYVPEFASSDQERADMVERHVKHHVGLMHFATGTLKIEIKQFLDEKAAKAPRKAFSVHAKEPQGPKVTCDGVRANGKPCTKFFYLKSDLRTRCRYHPKTADELN